MIGNASVARPIFHIGFHKTATTWFQKSVWPAAVSHHFVSRAQARAALLDEPGLCFDETRARKLLGGEGLNQPIAVCEETLSGYIHNGGMHGLLAPEVARRIHRLFPDAKIVIFLRSQPDLVRATYAQYVSGGGTHRPARYLYPHKNLQGALRYPYKAPFFNFEQFEFDRLIAYYDSLFGSENVHVYLYEELRHDQPALLERMERELGIEFDRDAIDTASRNVSLGAAGLAAMRAVNLFTRQSVVDKTVLVDIPGWQGVRHAAKALIGSMRLPGRRTAARLGRRIEAEIRLRYMASNQRLAALRDLPLEQCGYPM